VHECRATKRKFPRTRRLATRARVRRARSPSTTARALTDTLYPAAALAAIRLLPEARATTALPKYAGHLSTSSETQRARAALMSDAAAISTYPGRTREVTADAVPTPTKNKRRRLLARSYRRERDSRSRPACSPLRRPTAYDSSYSCSVRRLALNIEVAKSIERSTDRSEWVGSSTLHVPHG